MTDQELLEKAEEKRQTQFVRRRRKLEDFRYDEQQGQYWDTTTGLLLEAKSVDGAVHHDDWYKTVDKEGHEKSVPPSKSINSIDTGLTVEGATWWPGKPRFIENVVVSKRGTMPLKGAICYNSYNAPEPPKKTDIDPTPWINHVKKLYPNKDEHEHFFDFCAHMIQRPGEKVNYGIVMAGAQGIGKDTALLPVRFGVGEWNAAEVGPDAITGAFNGHIKSVLLVINEVRPNDEEFKASNFYNVLKPLLAAPPEMLPMTEKYMNTIYIRNLCHVILTTNDPLSMYIPEEDRRLFVLTSQLDDPKKSGQFPKKYFDELYDFLYNGGKEAVVWWLQNRDISEADFHTLPSQTLGKRQIIQSAKQVRRTIIDDVLDDMFGENLPLCIFHKDISAFIEKEGFDNREEAQKQILAKNFHFKMAERGFDMVRKENGGEWKKGQFRTRTVFIAKSVPENEREELIAAELAKK